MAQIRIATGANPFMPGNPRPAKPEGFTAAYKLAQAQTLLMETNQYDRWLSLRQNNVAEAVKVADAVLKRHDLLVKSERGEHVDWDAFDRYTQIAADKGIMLYKKKDLAFPDHGGLSELSSPGLQPIVYLGPLTQAEQSLSLPGNPSIISEENLLILNVAYNDQVLNNGIAGYKSGEKIYLPLDELARTLDFKLEVNSEAGKARGWFIAEDRGFFLDLDEGKIDADGRQFDISQENAISGEGDIFIESNLMGTLFPVDFDTDLSEMSLSIHPREELPFQARLDREAKWNRPNAYGESPANLPRKESEYQFFSVPFVDMTLKGSSHNSSDKKFQGGYSLLAKGDIGYMSSEVFASGDDQKSLENLRISFERSDPEAGLLGPLKATNISAGDISTPAFPIIGGARRESGLSVSNKELNRTSEFDTTNFQGTLPPGWDVELYRNEILIETSRVGNDGKYSFEQVPVYFGNNDFKLILYGPQGQKRVETKQINVGDQMLKKGKGAYQFSVSSKNDEILDPGNKPDKPDQGSLKAMARYETGLSENISLNTGISSEAVDKERHNYLNAGIKGSFGRFSINSDYVYDTEGGDAIQVIGQTRIGPVSLRAKQELLNDFTDPDVQENLDPKTARTDISLNGTFQGDKSGPSIPFALSYRDTQRESSYEKVFGASLSANFKNLHLNEYLQVKDDSRSGSSSSQIDGYLQGTSQLGPVRLRGVVNYDIEPEPEITGVELSNFWRIDDQLSSELILNHEFENQETSGARLKFNWNNGKFILSPEVYADTDGKYEGQVSLNMSFGQEPRSGTLKTSSSPLADTGGISARVFNDNNLNQVFDKGDTPIPDARVKAVQSHRNARTDAKGIAFLTGLEKYKATDVTVDTDSLEDPFQEPLTKGRSVVPRPGHVDLIEIPVVTTGEIDGTLLREGKDGTKRPLANRTVQLIDAQGNLAQEVRSEYDGFYLFMGVKPGEYDVKVKPGDEPGRGMIDILPQRVTIGKDGTVASYKDIVFKMPEQESVAAARTDKKESAHRQTMSLKSDRLTGPQNSRFGSTSTPALGI